MKPRWLNPKMQRTTTAFTTRIGIKEDVDGKCVFTLGTQYHGFAATEAYAGGQWPLRPRVWVRESSAVTVNYITSRQIDFSVVVDSAWFCWAFQPKQPII